MLVRSAIALMRAKDNLRQATAHRTARHWDAHLSQTHEGDKTRRFINSLLDPKQCAAQALAQLYRQRRNIELGFREIKQSLQQGQGVLRSKQPELVMRGLGRIDCDTLLRRWMRLVVQHGRVKPTPISFHTAQHAIVVASIAAFLARSSDLSAAVLIKKNASQA